MTSPVPAMAKLSVVLCSVFLLMSILPGPVLSRDPSDPVSSPGMNPHQQPGGIPSLPQGMLPGPPVPVIPDTARALLDWAEGSVLPIALSVVPDTVLFGDVAAIMFEFPAGSLLPDLGDASWSAEWLSPAEGIAGEHLDRLEGLARSRVGKQGEAEGSTMLLVPVRVLRTDPFRLVTGEVESPVIHVRGRTTDLTETAAIRGPRGWGWNLWTMAGLALAATLLLLLIWRLVGRRNQPVVLEDWALPVPAWISAAGRLQLLLDSRDLDRGLGREFLDEFASITRGYAGDRYGIAAREMTGREIVEACRDRGFELAHPRQLARLIDEADRRRYDPEPVEPIWCRTQAGLLFDLMTTVRIIPRQTFVPAAIHRAAEQSWAALKGYVDGPEEVVAGAADAALSREGR